MRVQRLENNDFKHTRQEVTQCDGSEVKVLSFLALNYKLRGDTIQKLCVHNSNVALQMGQHQIVEMWKILAFLFEGDETSRKVRSKESKKRRTNVRSQDTLHDKQYHMVVCISVKSNIHSLLSKGKMNTEDHGDASTVRGGGRVNREHSFGDHFSPELAG
jgi:hypothetical protein